MPRNGEDLAKLTDVTISMPQWQGQHRIGEHRPPLGRDGGD